MVELDDFLSPPSSNILWINRTCGQALEETHHISLGKYRPIKGLLAHNPFNSGLTKWKHIGFGREHNVSALGSAPGHSVAVDAKINMRPICWIQESSWMPWLIFFSFKLIFPSLCFVSMVVFTHGREENTRMENWFHEKWLNELDLLI